MKTQFVNQLADGALLENEIFAIQEFARHKDKNGNPYLRLVLQDKTGDIAAKIWSDSLSKCKITEESIGNVIEITGTVSSYKGKPQITIKICSETEDYDLEDLIQVSDKGLDDLFNKIKKYAESIRDKYLLRLFENLFNDKKLVRKFKEAPAAEMIHHDFVGGLMEHIVELLEVSDSITKLYPDANADLVKAGIILHDIGKVEEIERVGTVFSKTKKGRLIGHLAIGIEITREHLPQDFPDELWLNLWHILLSHHGLLEYGSPVVPKTIEAAIVHELDRMSAQVQQYAKELALSGEGREFSDYARILGTQVYLTKYDSVSDENGSEGTVNGGQEEGGGYIPADPDQVSLI